MNLIEDHEKRIASAIKSFRGCNKLDIIYGTRVDLEAKINAAVASLGLGVTVAITGGEIPEPKDSAAWDVLIVVFENTLANRDKSVEHFQCTKIATEICARFKSDPALNVNPLRLTVLEAEKSYVIEIKATTLVELEALEDCE